MNFLDFLNEAKEQLDISILAASKYLTTTAKIEEFLSSDVTIEHKTDGVKLTVIKQANNGNLKDYIFAYKGSVLYSTEFDYQPNTKVKKESIGSSQFKAVFEHFDKLSKNSIPVGTELFIEFLMRKPTLSSNYNVNHKMVLIGYSKSSWSESFGKLKTSPSGFETSLRDEYAKQLNIDAPQLLFKGVMGSPITFNRGIKHKVLQTEFDKRKNSMTWDKPELLLDDMRQMFLDIESKYGGKEEGVVLQYNGRILKWQQEYQLDQNARRAIKAKYMEENPDAEAEYWKKAVAASTEIVNSMVIKSRKLDDLMAELSLAIKRFPLDFEHSKRTDAVVRDDIQHNAKLMLIKKMRGNNNALILGKFRVFTKEGHYKLIKRAATLYDNVVICIVTSKETEATVKLREKMVRKCFPKAEIIHHNSGNLLSILNKSPININVVYAGTDRVSAYQQQLRTVLGTSVRELPRDDSDISASKIIANIEDEDYFMKNTPKEIHSMYNEIKKAYT